MTNKAWSDEARAAAAEARRTGGKKPLTGREVNQAVSALASGKPVPSHLRNRPTKPKVSDGERAARSAESVKNRPGYTPWKPSKNEPRTNESRFPSWQGLSFGKKAWSDEARAASAMARQARESKPSTGPSGIPQREGRIRKPEKFSHRKPGGVWATTGGYVIPGGGSRQMGKLQMQQSRAGQLGWGRKGVKKDMQMEMLPPSGGMGMSTSIDTTIGGIYPFKPRTSDSYGQPRVSPSMAEVIAHKFDGVWDDAKVRIRGPIGSPDTPQQ